MPAHQYFPLFCHFSISRSYVTSTLQAMTYQSCLPASAHQNYLRSLPRSLQMYPDLQAFLIPSWKANMQQTSPVPWCGLFPYRLDHFRDPTYTGTDHTREQVPFLAYSKSMEGSGKLADTDTFAVIGATVADNFNIAMPENTIGTSLLGELK